LKLPAARVIKRASITPKAKSMSLHSRARYVPGIFALFLVLIAGLPTAPSYGGQQASKKLTKQDVIDLLTQDASNEDVAAAARDSGISFQVTASAEKEIRAAGGNDQLIRALRSLAPRATPPPVAPHAGPSPSPPVLMIESTPGQSQVYVDDELIGSTSDAGRLKETHRTAGDHRVRVSLSGYQDYEETVTLKPGETATVAATLQQRAQQVTVPPLTPRTENTPPAVSGQPGYLGVQAAAQQPAGGRGVMVTGTAPGGPAAQAGLKSSDTILAVNGQTVNSPQDLRGALASHQAGEVVQISWYNGSNTVTRQVRLSAAPQQMPVVQPQPQPPVQPQPQPQPEPSLRPRVGVVSFPVAHDHGQSGQQYCTGMMTIGNGMILYQGAKGTNGVHNFEIPLNLIKEVRRNSVYLVALGAFHIHTKKGTNFNFAALDQQSRPTAPDAVLTAIDNAMGK
jgi:hypothetical protein